MHEPYSSVKQIVKMYNKKSGRLSKGGKKKVRGFIRTLHESRAGLIARMKATNGRTAG